MTNISACPTNDEWLDFKNKILSKYSKDGPLHPSILQLLHISFMLGATASCKQLSLVVLNSLSSGIEDPNKMRGSLIHIMNEIISENMRKLSFYKEVELTRNVLNSSIKEGL